MKVIKIDDNGFFIEDVILDSTDSLDKNMVIDSCPAGLYKPRWTGSMWVEGKTQDEFIEDAFLSALQPSTKDIEIAERELEVIDLLLDLGVF